MDPMLRDKICLITGAGSGIGRASALLFAHRGATVVAADIDEGALAETRDMATEQGLELQTATVDVTVEGDVERMIGGVVERHGRLDCALNNVGAMGSPTALTDTSLRDWQKIVDINLTCTFLCMKHEIPPMLAGGGGSIVNTASGAGIVGMATLSPYSAAKHAVLGLTKSAAQEYATQGIRVNAICPGTTDTPFLRANIGGDEHIEAYLKSTLTANGQFGQPEQVAQAALWLCSDLSSWVSGESMLVDGGFVCR